MEKKKHATFHECQRAFVGICLCIEVAKADVENYVCCGWLHKTCRGRIVYTGKVK